MAGLCAICEAQPAKYKCPVDGVSTCSLACSKTHKGATCAVTTAASPSPERSSSLAAAATVSVADADPAAAAQGLNTEKTPPAEEFPDFHRLASSRELQELFKRSPSLRDGLQGIYQLSLEENWMETIRARESNRGRYKGPQTRHLGRWTEEKGFKRGLGKVKKIRNNNDRSNTFDQVAFGEFCRLVLGQQPLSHD
ncbi:hypothetical protein KEM56_005745 [Ascosphaera pollenicola]|nr:hypothetical protein KEM56_005745 [Ascosphaera pollenicola]